MALYSNRINACSFADVIEEQRIVSLELLTSTFTVQKAIELTSGLPVNLSPFWGYEIPLSNEELSCDFLCCINNPLVLLPAIQLHQNNQSPSATDDLTYSGIRRLCKQWNNGTETAFRLINNIWLEFDCKDLSASFPVANFFFGPKDLTNHLEFIAVCERLFEEVSTYKIDGSTYRFLLKCLTLLPPSAYISQVGRMLARNHNQVRLFIQGLGKNG